MKINRIDLFLTGGVGFAPGIDPIETAPRVDVAISYDLGLSWSNYRQKEFGAQGRSPNVRFNNWGLCRSKGLKLRVRSSDPVHFALIGGTYEAQPLRN